MNINKIIVQYRTILATDGIISKEELIGMLKVDTLIETRDYNKLADRILKDIKPRKERTVIHDKVKTHNERMRLYEQGLSDKEISEIEKCDKMTIYYWRRDNKLAANPTELQRENQKKYEKRMEFYSQGFSDKEIASKCNETKSTIKGWRERNKLPANKRKKGKEKSKCLYVEKDTHSENQKYGQKNMAKQ